ncbi:MAG: GNAT family N-acetyltransferase [Bacteroidia bacterium]
MEEALEVINNTEKLRFELKIDEDFAIIEYRWHKGDIVFMHTFVPEAGQGRGIAGKMAKVALEYVRDNNLKMKLYCPYMASYVERKPEYKEFIR